MKHLTGAWMAGPRGPAAEPDRPRILLEKLGIEATTAQRIAARHGDVLFLSLQSFNAPLALNQHDGDGFTVDSVPEEPNRRRRLPRGFGPLALAQAQQAPIPSLVLLRAARECSAYPQTRSAVEAAYAIALRASTPAVGQPTAQSALSPRDQDQASTRATGGTTAAVDSLKAESSASQDHSEIDSGRGPHDHARTAGADPLQDMVLPAIPHEPQAVREASATGAIRLGQALARGDPVEARTHGNTAVLKLLTRPPAPAT